MIRPYRTVSLQGQESVWDFPRPAIAQNVRNTIRVIFAANVVAETRNSIRTIETSHPPSYYIPPGDVEMQLLRPNGRRTFCEWKGDATYFDVVVGERVASAAAWCYPNPANGFRSLRNYIAFYPGAMDECYVDDDLVSPQPGRFYGGWVTPKFSGPFKGEPGTETW